MAGAENAARFVNPSGMSAPTGYSYVVEVGAGRTIYTAGQVALDLDRLEFDDLSALWPVGLGRGVRNWVLENVTAGVAHDGHVVLGFAAPAQLSGLSDLHLTSAGGRLAGNGLTVHWLRPIPPVTHGSATLQLVDADTLRVELGTGQQTASSGHVGELSLERGSVLITGLSQPDQVAEIRVDAALGAPLVGRDPRLDQQHAAEIQVPRHRGDRCAHPVERLRVSDRAEEAGDRVEAMREAEVGHVGAVQRGAGQPPRGDFEHRRVVIHPFRVEPFTQEGEVAAGSAGDVERSCRR